MWCRDGQHLVAGLGRRRLYRLAARGVATLIHIEAAWLSSPLDMRAGTDTALARVVKVFGSVRPHHAYLFGSKRAPRIKALFHDCVGIWLVAALSSTATFIWSG